MEAIKFSSFRLLVSNSLGPLPAGPSPFDINWGTGSCIAGFSSTLGDDAGSLPTGVTDPSVGLRFLFSGSLERKNKELPKEKRTKKKKRHKEKGNESSRPLPSFSETSSNHMSTKAVWIIFLHQTAWFELQLNLQKRILKLKLGSQ